MRGKYVIAGIGHTAYGKLPGRSTVSMNVEAARKALQDAAIEKAAVDAVFVKVPTTAREAMYGQTLSEALGLQPKWSFSIDQGGAANLSLVSIAAMGIDAGQCDVALVCYADTPRSGSRDFMHRSHTDEAGVFGWSSAAAGYAMIHRAHINEYGTKPEDFAAIAMACRRHGASNPDAQLKLPLTLDAYLSAPWIVEPLRRDDCCLVSDGGAALVIMSAKRARELNVPAPVPILGFGHGQTTFDLALRPKLTESMAKVSAATAFAMAGIGPEHVDVVQLYDCFTVVAMMALEEYGFCKPGQVGDFAREGRLEIGGDLPLNTSGGLLSETGMPGLQLVMEAVRQIRGTAANQVKNARNAVVSNQGGLMQTHATLVLGA